MKILSAEIVDFLNQIIETQEDVYEVISWWLQLLSDGPPPDRILALTGSGPSGKSTLFKLMIASVSAEKSHSTMLSSLRDNFGLANVSDKRLLVVHEITARAVACSGFMLKALVTGDQLVCNKKYQNPFVFVPQCGIAIETDVLPVNLGTDLGLSRRMLVIKTKQLDQEVCDPGLLGRLTKSIQAD